MIVEVSDILALLPDRLLDELAAETKVNYYSKKLQGQVMFKLLLYCILCYKDNSLRIMQSAYESIGFRLLNAHLPSGSIHYSSISERLNALESTYVEKLYKACVKIYRQQLSKKETQQQPAVIRFDSTIVSLSATLLKTGYHLKGGDADHVRQLKFTIGLSDIPTAAHFFNEQVYTSENTALKEAIFTSIQPVDKAHHITVFDKGINSRKTYDRLTEEHVPFVSRVEVHSRYEELLTNQLESPVETPTLTIVSDSWAYLFSSNGKSTHPFRLIRAVIKRSGEELLFISNIADLSAEVIAAIYKRRWDIEAFFKFLKQELHFSHLVNRTENGIRVMFYATMIAAVLLLVYKTTNQLNGYKIVKHQFINELQTALVRDFVLLCGGNPDLVDRLLNKPPPL